MDLKEKDSHGRSPGRPMSLEIDCVQSVPDRLVRLSLTFPVKWNVAFSLKMVPRLTPENAETWFYETLA